MFQYNIDKKDGISNDRETVYWRCSNRHKSSCKAHVHSVNGVITKQLNEYNHINDQRDVKLVELVTVVKERAVNMATPANIISNVTMGLSAAVRAQIVEKKFEKNNIASKSSKRSSTRKIHTTAKS